MLLDDRMKEKEIKEVYDSYAYFNKATEEHRLLNEWEEDRTTLKWKFKSSVVW